MKINWQVDAEDIGKVKEFFGLHRDNAFVKMRVATNLNDDKSPVTKELFWEVMIACLLTTQQRSGPGSPVTKFISTGPCLLGHELCRGQSDLDVFVTKVLSDFGGLRRSMTIGQEAKANWTYLEGSGWEATLKILERVRLHGGQSTGETPMNSDQECKCFDPKCGFDTFDRTDIGVDETCGRFGSVDLDRCKHCGRCWLHYFVEYEAFSRSGRWYRGLITPEQLASVTPENAVAVLSSLPWHFYGGSYFDCLGAKGVGAISV